MNKYQGLADWFANNYIPLNGWIYFNSNTMEDGSVSIIPLESEKALNSFNSGAKEVQFLFAIAMIKDYSTEMSTINADAMAEADDFIEWIAEQNSLENFPNLGDNKVVSEVTALDSVPSTSVDPEQNVAKIQFNCSITFLEV